MANKTEWLEDKNGNLCSVQYFGGKKAAQKALDSLKKCIDCVNCSDCSDCSGCSVCSDCSDCSGCSGCSYCSDCSGCSVCSGCSDCSYCSGCSDCSRCSVCSGCSYCSGCSRCSVCSGCSDCSYCSDCSDCSDCSGCSDLKNNENNNKPPPIPSVKNIHSRIFEAASQPKALDMSSFHTCEKTHCRAGWAVTLAGDEGKELEAFYNTELAAMLIYDESAPNYKINPCRFYDKNDDALADMKIMAEREQGK